MVNVDPAVVAHSCQITNEGDSQSCTCNFLQDLSLDLKEFKLMCKRMMYIYQEWEYTFQIQYTFHTLLADLSYSTRCIMS